MQDLLSKDYTKNGINEFFRFIVIFGNIMVFYYFSGVRQKNNFGPIIPENGIYAPFIAPIQQISSSGQKPSYNDPMTEFSLLDMVALLLAVLLSMKQLSFGRPDIDSFKEVIYLPAQEKTVALIVFIFSIFKWYYQARNYLPDDYDIFILMEPEPNKLTNILNRGYFMLNKKKHLETWLQSTNWNNFCLVLSSLICLISSYTFKFEMRNAEKGMTLKIIRFASVFTWILLVIILGYVTFVDENKCVCMIFLFIVLFDVLRIVRLILYGKKKGDRVEITDYLMSLKWVTFAIVGMLVFGSFFYRQLRDYVGLRSIGRNRTEYFDSYKLVFQVVDWFTLYTTDVSNPKKMPNVTPIYMLLLCIVIMEFLSKVALAAKLDIFDMEVFDKMDFSNSTAIKSEEEPIELSPDSYIVKYFTGKIFSIFEVSEDSIFTNTFNYQTNFVSQLASESIPIDNELEKFKTRYMHTLNHRQNITANLFMFIKWLRRFIIMQGLIRMEAIIRHIINLFSMWSFLFYVRKPQFSPLMVYSLLFWNIFSMVTQSPKVMMWVTIVLIFPAYFLDYAQTIYIKLKRGQSTSEETMTPFNRYSYLFVLVLGGMYLGLTLLAQMSSEKATFYHKLIESMQRKNKVSNDKFLNILYTAFDVVRIRFNKVYRYVPIFLAMITALHSISLLNLIMLIFALIFMWSAELDKKYWSYFNSYVIFALIIKQIGNYTLNLESYNIEVLAIIGFISVERTPKGLYDLRTLMVFNFALVYFSCGWYKKLHMKLTEKTLKQIEEDELQMDSLSKLDFIVSIAKFYNFFAMLFQYYSIWIFHILANLILLTDTRDILSVVLIIVESVIALIHIVTWNRSGVHPYNKIYKTWIISYYMVLFYGLSRYLLFFLKYTSLQTMLGSGEIVDPNAYFNLNEHLFKSINSLDQNRLHDVSTFFAAFVRPLMLISLAVLTRETFLRTLDIGEKRPKLDPLISIEKQARDKKTTNLSESKASHREREQKSDVSKMTRLTNPFVVIYLIFKGVFLAMIMKYFHNNMNFFKLFMLVCYLLNMKTLFSKLILLCDRMRLGQLFTLRSKYFFLTFLTSNKWKKTNYDEHRLTSFYTEEIQKKDLAQNKMYYEQFILRMETILFSVNRTFWGLAFFPLLVLMTSLVILNYFLKQLTSFEKYKIDLIFGISNKLWTNEQAVNEELIGIQIVLTLLFIEYMLTSYYLDCKKVLVELPEPETNKLLDVLEVKYKFLVDCRLDNFRDNFDEKMTSFEQAVQFLPEKVDKNALRKMNTMNTSPVRQVKATIVSEEFLKAEGDLTDAFGGLKHLLKEAGEAAAIEEAAAAEKMIVEANNQRASRNAANKNSPGTQILAEEEVSSEEIKSVGDISSSVDSSEEAESQEGGSDDGNKNEDAKKNIPIDPDIFNMMISLLNANKSEVQIYYMTELITKEEMLLFLYKNRYKYFMIKFMEGLMYCFTRFGLFPLLIPLTNSINIFTIPFYILFLTQSFRVKRTFLEDVQSKNVMVVCFLMLQTLHEFIHVQFVSQVGGNAYSRFFLSQSFGQLHHLLRPIDGAKYSLCYFWLFINSLGFATIPIFIWLTTKALFREKLRKGEQYHFYLFDQARKRNIVIDYSKWRRSPIQWMNWYYKGLYINTMDIHSMIVMISIIFGWKTLFIFIFMLTLGVTAYEHFKFDTSDSTKANKKPYLRKMLRVYMIGYWVMLGLYHIIELLGSFGFFREFSVNRQGFMSNYDGGILLLFLMTFTGVVEDLMYSQDYFDINDKLKAESELKIRYASLCAAYDINERKIYYRVLEMMKKKIVDEISLQVLERKDFSGIAIDTNYNYKDIIQIIQHNGEQLTKKYLSWLGDVKVDVMNSLYTFMISKSNNYRDQDMLFLYQNVKNRNSSVLNKEEMNLEDYFNQDLNFFQKEFTEVSIYYDMLREGESSRTKLYGERFAQFMGEQFINNLDEFEELKKGKHLAMPNAQDLNPNIQSRRKAPAKNMQKLNKEQLKNKPEEHLKAASEILQTFLTTKFEEDTKNMLDNYKLEFNKRGHLNCNFGRMKIILYNIKLDDIVTTLGYSSFDLGTFSKYMVKVITSNSEYVVSFALIVIHVLNGGLFNIIVIGILIFTTFVEETTGRSLWWRILYSIYFFVMLFKRIFQINTYLEANPQVVVFLFGPLSTWADIICILLAMYMINLLKKFGVDNKSAIDFENPGMSIARLTINQDFNSMVDRICTEEVKKKEQLNIYLSKKVTFPNEGSMAKDFKMLMIKQVIKNYTQYERFKRDFMTNTQKFVRIARYDMLKVSPNDLDRFAFRNFSSFLRKPGASYNGIASILLIAMIFYVLIIFPAMNSEKTKFASFVFENRVTAFTVINFGIYLTFFILHYYLDQMKCSDNKGLVTKEYMLTLMSQFDAEKNKNMKPSLMEIFRRAVTKVKTVHLLTHNSRHPKGRVDYKENPLFYLFLFSISLWIYINVSTFFWHNYHGNYKAATKTGIHRFICQSVDKEGDLNEANKVACKNYLENPYSMAFYGLNIAYLIVCMLQIKAGKAPHTSKITDFNSIKEKSIYAIIAALPLVRETRIAFEYCATKTTLWFSDFVLLKELEFVLQDAKQVQDTNNESKTGTQLARILQNAICWAVIILVITLFVVPLYLFFNSDNRTYYEITSASINIDMLVGKGQKVMSLFSSARLKNNQVLLNVNSSMVSTLQSYDTLRRYDSKRFIVSCL